MNLRISKMTFAAAALAVAVCSPTVRAQDAKPLGVVALSSYDELMADIDFLGSLGDQVGMSQQLDMMINMFTQNKGLVGFDKTQPIGVIVQISEATESFGGAVCLPVTDMEGLLGVLAPFGVKGADRGDGVYEVDANGQTVYARTQGGWAFLAPMEQMLESLPANPGQTISDLNQDYDLGIKLNVQNIPAAYREQFAEMFSQAAQQGLQQEAGESDEDFAERRAAFEAQLDQAKRQFEEMDTATVGLTIDREQQRAFLDILYTALPGTQLAEQIAANVDSRTNFAGFFQPDSAMMASFASKVSESDVAQIDQQLAGARQQIYRAIEDESELSSDESKQLMREAIDDFIDAVTETLKDGVMDGGAVLNLNADALTFVAGGVVTDTSKVEDGLKKLVEVSDKEGLGLPPVNWNSQSYGDLSFHTMSHPTEDDDQGAQQLFGDAVEVAVGIGEKSVYFAAGRNWLDAVKKVVDDSQANPNKSVPPMEMTVSLAPICKAAAELVDVDDRANIQMIADMLYDEAPGRDKLRVTSTCTEEMVKVRFELEEGVLRAIGLAANQARREAAAAGF